MRQVASAFGVIRFIRVPLQNHKLFFNIRGQHSKEIPEALGKIGRILKSHSKGIYNLTFENKFDIFFGKQIANSRWEPKSMIQTFEAIVDKTGTIRLLEPVKLPSSSRILITVLDEKPSIHINEEALLSEAALAEDWNRP